jgi:hypothetical protein
MADEDQGFVLDRYRAGVEDVPGSDLDETILAAARRQSAARRAVRRTYAALFVAAFAAIATSLAWRSQQVRDTQSRVADYGKSEGAARSYLLNVTTSQYSEAGSAEGAP